MPSIATSISATPVFPINVIDFDVAKNNAVWGTYGKHGTDPLTYKKLVDLDTDHLETLLNEGHVGPLDPYAFLIRSILEDRNVK